MIIRKAEKKDLVHLLEIYNYEVMHGISTLDLAPKTIEEWDVWFCAHNVDNHPLFVAEADNQVAGYASLSAYREKEAFKTTVELSIYIGPEHRNKGIASALMKIVLDEAKRDEKIHTIVSVITAGNEGSRRLHEKFGFEFCGTIKEVGMKFGTFRDIENYSLIV
ncbi:N-acetyltransferase [Anaerocolumna cellulosilytica]|uniref:N-acetyltransferase n=1 Tax=Anaerocolumna cellulosilytica TaxID=433286 RepID=A0A6S6RD62_9FIRM|nr:GNAT family N-acetyltransferase [Anaerocolumna cellulosilytica]MBB5195179.1 phosphinothricin acetyltransferase [Anaerocolumna cellulosilytica]BCJ96651.1 N-acetyltransferase [Anaerocolumna cellulosilytica]